MRKFPKPEYTHLLLELRTGQCENVAEDSEGDEVVVFEQLCSSEGGERIQEELTTPLEVANGEEMKTLVDLESVASVPIAAFLDEAVN